MKACAPILMVGLLLAASVALGQGGDDVLKKGQEVYEANCADCHRTNGEGLPVKFPALKGNTFVTGDPKPVIDILINGRKGKLGQMPAWKDHLDDAQIAAAISYIRNAWGNQAPAIKPEDVAPARKN
ncbi:MAG: cytochrome c [Desulfobaccales bacterium]